MGLSRSALGPLLAYLGPLLDALGLLLRSPFAHKAARQQQGAPSQSSPESHPRIPKRTAQTVTFSCHLQGQFSDPLRHSLSENFLGASTFKPYDFVWGVLQKCCFPQVAPRARNTVLVNERGVGLVGLKQRPKSSNLLFFSLTDDPLNKGEENLE